MVVFQVWFDPPFTDKEIYSVQLNTEEAQLPLLLAILDWLLLVDPSF